MKGLNSHSFGFFGKESNFKIDKEKVFVKNGRYDYSFSNRHITGQHNFFNLSVAFIIAKNLNPGSTEKLISLCESFKPTENRSQWIKLGDSNIFLDAYNANPSSMRAAVKGFLEKAQKPFTLIIGDMNELGYGAAGYHEKLGEELAEMDLDNLIFVGKHAMDFAAKCKKSMIFENSDKLKTYFRSEVLGSSKYIFIKGSRSLQLESILDITSH